MALPEPAPGSVALVTGASSGIGAELARELARRGLDVALVARRGPRLEELASELATTHGVEAHVLTCDLGEVESRRRLERELAELGLRPSVLVNNAGFGLSGRFAGQDRERQVELLRVNVEAVTDLASTFAPAMLERGAGAILNVASLAAFQPVPTMAVYSASKAYVLSLSESLHSELAGRGVTVTAVCPGPVPTEFWEVAGTGRARERTPGVAMVSAGTVARAAVEGLERGKRVVVPGALVRAAGMAGHHSPRAAILPLIRRGLTLMSGR